MTRMPDELRGVAAAWRRGQQTGHQDAVAGRPPMVGPVYGYTDGYESHLDETCPCYATATVVPARAVSVDILAPTFTLNSAMRQTWCRNADLTKRYREYAARRWAEALAGKRLVSPVRVVAQRVLVRGRPVEDIGACAPAVKASIDGLVDAGGLPDDRPEYVAELVYRGHVYVDGPPSVLRLTAESLHEGTEGESGEV